MFKVGQVWYEIEPTAGNKTQVKVVLMMGGFVYVRATDGQVYRVKSDELGKTHSTTKHGLSD